MSMMTPGKSLMLIDIKVIKYIGQETEWGGSYFSSFIMV